MQNGIHVKDFPDPLLGVFYYTVDDGSNTNCGAGSVWDGCFVDDMIDRTTVKVNYTQCSTTLFGSSEYTYIRLSECMLFKSSQRLKFHQQFCI
jgi:hypothetical protein